MSIAEKLTQVAENQQKIYGAGYAAGQAEGSGGSYEEGYEQGKIDGDVTKYAVVLRFQNIAFPEGYELVASCLNATALPQCTKATGVKKIVIKDLSLDKQYSASNFLYACESVEEAVLIDGVRFNGANYMCTNCYGLQKIIGAMDMTGVTDSNMWQGCSALVEIRFVPNTIGASINFQHSADLSDASIQSIIDGLADLTGQTAQKVTFHTDVILKLTEEQIATILAKNWTF